jgi:hypothetical protein
MRVRAGRRGVLSVDTAVTTVAAGALHALLEADEAAVAAATATAAVAADIFAPRIVLRLRWHTKELSGSEQSQTDQKILHGCLSQTNVPRQD